jgi:hypothetical protein
MDVDGDRFAFHVGAANPALSLRLNGNAQEITTTSNFGEISGELPLSSMFGADAAPCRIDEMGNTICDPPPPPVVGTVGYRIGALKATTTMRANNDSVTIDGIDYGSGFAMTIDNQPLVAFDADVRTIKMSSSSDGLKVSVLPSLVANASLDFRNLANRVMDTELPSWMLDEDLTLELNGAAEPSVTFHEATNAVEVTAGQLLIRSRAAGKSVNVTAGQCLIALEPMEGTEPNPVELLDGGMCPAG